MVPKNQTERESKGREIPTVRNGNVSLTVEKTWHRRRRRRKERKFPFYS